MSQKFGNAKMYSLKDKLAEEAKEEAEKNAGYNGVLISDRKNHIIRR